MAVRPLQALTSGLPPRPVFSPGKLNQKRLKTDSSDPLIVWMTIAWGRKVNEVGTQETKDSMLRVYEIRVYIIRVEPSARLPRHIRPGSRIVTFARWLWRVAATVSVL